MSSSNHANYAKIGFALVSGIVAIVAALVYLGGVVDSGDELACETYYEHPVTGLSVGSEVNFRGVTIGTVRNITFVASAYDSYDRKDALTIVIRMAIDCRRFHTGEKADSEDFLRELVRHGLRATVSSSGITGLSKIEFNLPRAGVAARPPAPISWRPASVVVPPEPSMLEGFSDAATKVMNQINRMDFASAWSNLSSIASSASHLAASADAIVESQRSAIGEMMDNLNSAAGSLRELANELRENPSLLLRSREAAPLPETER